MSENTRYTHPPRIDAGLSSFGDDTQAQFGEPGNPDVAGARNPDWSEVDPPIMVRIGDGETVDTFTFLPTGRPTPPSGICLVGDGQSDVASTPPNRSPDNRDFYRIAAICEACKTSVKLTDRVSFLVGIEHVPSTHDRIGLIAVRLGAAPELIDNAEHVLQAGE